MGRTDMKGKWWVGKPIATVLTKLSERLNARSVMYELPLRAESPMMQAACTSLIGLANEVADALGLPQGTRMLATSQGDLYAWTAGYEGEEHHEGTQLYVLTEVDRRARRRLSSASDAYEAATDILA